MIGAEPSVVGRLIRPADADYDAARRVWNGAIDRRPALIVRCAEPADAAIALRYGREHGLPIAIRGGGHNVAGSAVCDGGVVIDFSEMRAANIDAERRVAIVQAGALWGDCDQASQPVGLAIPGGIVTHTGVAGLTLGGGIGWTMRKYGLTSDSLLSVEMILADGTQARVSPDSHPDLFWAIQGGGGNFGVVTSFEFTLHPIGPEVLAGPIVHRADRAADVLRFYRDFVADAPDELAVFVNLRTAPDLAWVPEELRGTPVVMLIPCYLGDLDEGARVLAPLRQFGPPAADLVQRKPYAAHQGMFDATAPHGWGYYWKSHFLPPLTDDCIDVLVEQAWQKQSRASYTLLFHMGGAVARGGDSAFGGRSAAHTVNLNAAWTEGGPSHPDIDWVRRYWQALAPHATGGLYVNFLGNEGADLVRAAYGPSYDRLAAIKARYDPDYVFRINQNIIPNSTETGRSREAPSTGR